MVPSRYRGEPDLTTARDARSNSVGVYGKSKADRNVHPMCFSIVVTFATTHVSYFYHNGVRIGQFYAGRIRAKDLWAHEFNLILTLLHDILVMFAWYVTIDAFFERQTMENM